LGMAVKGDVHDISYHGRGFHTGLVILRLRPCIGGLVS